MSDTETPENLRGFIFPEIRQNADIGPCVSGRLPIVCAYRERKSRDRKTHNIRVTTMATAKIKAMKSELISRGEFFSGSNPDSVAEDWAERFSVAAAGAWMSAGFWDCDAAEACREAGYTPSKMKAIAEDQTARGIEYSSGDLIYALCNCDASMDDITK